MYIMHNECLYTFHYHFTFKAVESLVCASETRGGYYWSINIWMNIGFRSACHLIAAAQRAKRHCKLWLIARIFYDTDIHHKNDCLSCSWQWIRNGLMYPPQRQHNAICFYPSKYYYFFFLIHTYNTYKRPDRHKHPYSYTRGIKFQNLLLSHTVHLGNILIEYRRCSVLRCWKWNTSNSTCLIWAGIEPASSGVATSYTNHCASEADHRWRKLYP